MLVTAVVAILFAGVLCYAVFGGADFGSGFWDLVAGGDRRGAPIRKRIDRSIGPVWEANHVWLIFVLVYLWTAFPQAFAAIATGLFAPLVGAAAGIVFRGGAFVFRKSASTLGQARFFGALFASSSVLTPFFLGAAVGAVASGRIPADGVAPLWSVWLAPTSLLGGVLAVGTCAWLAAVFLAADCAREGEEELERYFTRRALATGVVLGAVALGGVWVLEVDAPSLAARLETWAAPLVVLSAVGAVIAMVLLRRGRPRAARAPAVLAVVTILAGWAIGQYPWILVDELTLAAAAAAPAVLWGLVLAFLLAGVLVVPSLAWLFLLTQRGALSDGKPRADSSLALLRAASPSRE